MDPVTPRDSAKRGPEALLPVAPVAYAIAKPLPVNHTIVKKYKPQNVHTIPEGAYRDIMSILGLASPTFDPAFHPFSMASPLNPSNLAPAPYPQPRGP